MLIKGRAGSHYLRANGGGLPFFAPVLLPS